MNLSKRNILQPIPILLPRINGIGNQNQSITNCDPCTNLKDCVIKNFLLDLQVELEAAKYADLNEVMSDVQYELKKQLPGCQVLMFGSCRSQLAFKNSDVDLFLQCGEHSLSVFLKNSLYTRKVSLVIYCIYKLSLTYLFCIVEPR